MKVVMDGKVVEVSADTGNYMVSRGFAKLPDDEAQKTPVYRPAVTEKKD